MYVLCVNVVLSENSINPGLADNGYLKENLKEQKQGFPLASPTGGHLYPQTSIIGGHLKMLGVILRRVRPLAVRICSTWTWFTAL